MSPHRTAFFVLSLLAGFWAVPATAQKLTPGLWEHRMAMKSGGAEMEAGMARMREQLASMPPEKRKQFEAMMAAQGMSMGGAGGAPEMTLKVCLTPEQAARDEMPQSEGDCRQTSQERSGNTLRIRFECTGRRTAKGSGEYTLDSPRAHRGRTVVESTVDGKAQRVEMNHSARWLAADCGSVAPRKP